LARDSSAAVTMSFSPTEVMKSILTSTLFFLPQSSASCFITALAPGTQ
jgi:hypothetical protein